jgi:hypothetical protein
LDLSTIDRLVLLSQMDLSTGSVRAPAPADELEEQKGEPVARVSVWRGVSHPPTLALGEEAQDGGLDHDRALRVSWRLLCPLDGPFDLVDEAGGVSTWKHYGRCTRGRHWAAAGPRLGCSRAETPPQDLTDGNGPQVWGRAHGHE